MDHPEEKLFIENGEIEITKPATYHDKELSCTFTIDASTDFIPPSNLYTIIRILFVNFNKPLNKGSKSKSFNCFQYIQSQNR